MNILSLQNISKRYGRLKALKEVSFDVPEGSVFGILGPNGSGKTTLLGIVMDVLRANGGSFTWFGKEPDEKQRQQIGTLLETPNFYHYLSAYRNLEIAAAIKQKPASDIDRVLKIVRLDQRRDSAFSSFSLGMKQRLTIAACLLGNPSVLVFDEPTNGLDPAGIAEIRQLIGDLARDGKTIILASHLLNEVEKVCTHVAVLQQGKLIRAGKVEDVLTTDAWLEAGAADTEKLLAIARQMPGIKKIVPNEQRIQIYFEQGSPDAAAFNRFCFEQGLVLNHLDIGKKSLESAFIELTNNVSN